jgi:hypothetical protein
MILTGFKVRAKIPGKCPCKIFDRDFTNVDGTVLLKGGLIYFV